MVKFGRHLQAFLSAECGDCPGIYVVPYVKIRDVFVERSDDPGSPPPPTASDFESEWRLSLKRASDDFNGSVVDFWRGVFDGIRDDPESRGCIPDRALRTYISSAGRDAAQDLLCSVRRIHAAALTNAEALRKLVKKFDKRHGAHLSATLLPEVYAANFTVGIGTLEAGLALLRSELGMDADEGEEDGEGDHHRRSYGSGAGGTDLPPTPEAPDGTPEGDSGGAPRRSSDGAPRRSSDGAPRRASDGGGRENSAVDRIRLAARRVDVHEESVGRRKAELHWLRSLAADVGPDEMRHVVAHRGFHSPRDRSDRRPLENSLSAYEAAWTNGVHLCECDVALTKDERLILAHDEDFSRLALDPSSPVCNRKVTELTFKEILACPLKSGSRPPLLIDVLRSARAIGGESRLIVEIKPGNSEAGTAMARMFMRHPELMEHCAAVMSFDAFAMHTFRREMVALERAGCYGGERHGGNLVSLPTAMSLGNLGMRIDSFQTANGEAHEHDHYGGGGCGGEKGFIPLAEARYGSSDHFGVGLGERDDSFHFSPFGTARPQLRQQQQQHGPEHNGSPPLHRNGHPEGRSPPNDRDHNGPASPAVPVRAPPSPPCPGVPRVLLLTVCEPPARECELRVDITSPSDLSQLDGWIHSSDGSLHGVYLQFQGEMLEEGGLAALRGLAGRGYAVGVWGYNGKDPDNYETLRRLVREGGVEYVNSDLPRRFKAGV